MYGYICRFFNSQELEKFCNLSYDEQTRFFWKFFVNFRDKHGRTPMHYAAQKGHVNVVTLLKNLAKKKMNTCKKRKALPGAGSSSQYQTTTTSKKTKSRLFFCSREWARSNALCSQYQTTTTLARPLKGFSLCQARHQSPARHLIPRDYKGQTIYVCRAPADGKSVYWKQPLVCKTCHTIGKRNLIMPPPS